MLKAFCSWVLYRLMGWHTNISVAFPNKCIVCLAPHTSNWDFVIGHLFSKAEGFKSSYLMKKEWFFFPLGWIFRKTGGIPVYRKKHVSMTDSLAEAAIKESEFHLCVTPEGTRKPNPDWKKGFYFIALKAKIPILLFGVDYEKKLIECIHSIIPSGDVEKELAEIKHYYKDFKGRHAENFAI